MHPGRGQFVTTKETRILGIEEKGRALLHSATSLIDEGVNWTWSLREIADDAGAASNEIYRRFGSKEVFIRSLCTLWHSELQAQLDPYEGIQRLAQNLRWIVSHRKRIIFLVAEGIQARGVAQLAEELSMFLPPIESVIVELEKVEGKWSRGRTRAELSDSVAAAIQAGIGLLLFAPSPYAEDAPNEDDLLLSIWQKLWQITTELDGESAPNLFSGYSYAPGYKSSSLD